MILVTGANGFVGKHLVRELLNKGYDVRCFVRKKDDFLDNLNVERFYGDITNKYDVETAVSGVEKVIHLAAVLGSSDKELNYRVNFSGTRNVVESCLRNNVQKLVYVSSVSASRTMRSVYGESKLLAENFVKSSGLNYVILRPSLIYGNGGRGFGKIINYIEKLPFIPVIGDGNSIRRPVYVWDVVKAIVSSIESSKCICKVYDIGGSKLSFNELIDKIALKLNVKKKKVYVPVWLCFFIARAFSLFSDNPKLSLHEVIGVKESLDMDIGRAREDLDFNPISFDDGLDKIFGF